MDWWLGIEREGRDEGWKEGRKRGKERKKKRVGSYRYRKGKEEREGGREKD